jgi:hypothetical protein
MPVYIYLRLKDIAIQASLKSYIGDIINICSFRNILNLIILKSRYYKENPSLLLY